MIEDKIKHILRKHKADIDIEKLWSELEPHVPIQNKKRRVFPFFIFVAAVALVGYLYLAFYPKQIQKNRIIPNDIPMVAFNSDQIEMHEVVKVNEVESRNNGNTDISSSLKNIMVLTNENESIDQVTIPSNTHEIVPIYPPRPPHMKISHHPSNH